MRLRTIVMVLLLLGWLAPAVAGEAVRIAGYDAQEALRLGERIYRQGILPSGEPMQALVQGDIPVEGTMFSCESCHLRSGLGSLEGTVVVLPTNAAELYKPFTMAAEEALPKWQNMPTEIQGGIRRPAYTDETLALALWTGFDPSGREMLPIMPRYLLEDGDMAILVHYLKHLCAAPSPGVDDTTLHLATVVSADLPATQRQAVLSTLQAYVETRNNPRRLPEKRAKFAPFWDLKMYSAYRRLEHHVWELKGAPETWEKQLADYYRQTPVFALWGGMTTGEWAPVHRFCERNRIPCIFPITDYPVLAEGDWYTLYFSKGHYQEGEAAARYLRPQAAAGKGLRIVQVRRDDPASQALARGFEETWRQFGQPPPETVVLAPGEAPLPRLDRLREQSGDATVLLWLGPEVYPALAAWAAAGPPPAVFVAAGRLGEELKKLPEAARPFTLVTYPGRLPDDAKKIHQVVRSWLRVEKLPEIDLAIQSDMYFAGWILSNGLMMMQSNYYRDYFLDVYDMMNDQTYAIAGYPRLSFGAGQRYAAKGCYVVRLGPGPEPPLQPLTGWVIH